jgi:hypothetical protein
MSAKLFACGIARRKASRFGLVTILTALSSGCAGPIQNSPGPEAADAAAQATHYRSVTAGYVSQRPVVPGEWRTRNDSVAPRKDGQ